MNRVANLANLVRLDRGRRILDVEPVTDPAMRPPLRRVPRDSTSRAEASNPEASDDSMVQNDRASMERTSGTGEISSSSERPSDRPPAVEQTGPMRDVPVDWEALEDAFENNAPEVHSYLHLVTGDVLRIVDGVADPQMHARIAADSSYLRIDPVSSREQYRWMERYIPMVEDPDLQQKLTQAIDGKGAFRRFKDVLMAYGPERERWFSFRSERLRIFMEAWLSAHALTPVTRPVWATDAPKPDQASVADGTVTPLPIDARQAERRGRNAESLRKNLREIADSLGPRDLDTLVAFAEFIRARRATRSFAHHFGEATQHSQEEDAPSSQESPVVDRDPE